MELSGKALGGRQWNHKCPSILSVAAWIVVPKGMSMSQSLELVTVTSFAKKVFAARNSVKDLEMRSS